MFTLFEETESEREWEKKTRKRTNEINHFHFVCSVNHCMNAKTKAWGVSWTFFATFCGILPASELYSFRFSFALLVWNLFVLLAFLLLLIFFLRALCHLFVYIMLRVIKYPICHIQSEHRPATKHTHTHTNKCSRDREWSSESRKNEHKPIFKAKQHKAQRKRE